MVVSGALVGSIVAAEQNNVNSGNVSKVGNPVVLSPAPRTDCAGGCLWSERKEEFLRVASPVHFEHWFASFYYPKRGA